MLEERLGTVPGFTGAWRCGTEDDPVYREPGVLLRELQKRAAAANFDVVGMRAETQHGKRSIGPVIWVERDHGLMSKSNMSGAWRCQSFFPDLPRRLAARVQLLELLLVLERVHWPVETLVTVGAELVGLDKPVKRLGDEFFSILEVVEDLLAEDIVAAIDADLCALDVGNVGHRA